ncbi:hypothetical protein [Ahrensia sp. 13_GOM-1096m]|uniref:hypothetical protein n=1 Tax=Ahrensia sp. 13_GOM-1096m TaxID=1380380 RepID=UPI00047A7AD9|nr:hypothetical protein [Ahrensia sp. 13_GOM-1096m]
MKKNDNSPKAEFTEEGELIVSLTKSLFAGDSDATFRVLKDYMAGNDLKVSEEIIQEFQAAGLIAKRAQRF